MPLGVKTCPSLEPMLANVERKLQEADAAPVQTKRAANGIIASASQRYLLRRGPCLFAAGRCRDGVLDFISISFPYRGTGQRRRARRGERARRIFVHRRLVPCRLRRGMNRRPFLTGGKTAEAQR